MPNIYFYIHPYFWPKSSIPSNPDLDWPGFGFGIYTWTIQTYLRLKQFGLKCELVSEIPKGGILIAHRECLSFIDKPYQGHVLPNNSLFIVDLAADLGLYPFANMHVVQSKYQSSNYNNCYFVPHWPQPGLIKRDISRGDIFKNLAFLGNRKNLAKELNDKGFKDKLKEIGLSLIIKDQLFVFDNPDTYATCGVWNDYSDIDAVIAVRHLNLRPRFGSLHKPATKLYNAWIAGVPAIIGRDYQCNEERKSNLDYIEVDNIDEIFSSLCKLKENHRFRRAVVDNGFQRANEITPEMTVSKWMCLMAETIIPNYNAWVKMSAMDQSIAIARQYCSLILLRFIRKMSRVVVR